MQEKLNYLIRLFQEENVVEKIAEATDKLSEYKKQKKQFSEELKILENALDRDEVIGEEYDILPEHALQICVICIMAGIEDCELFEDYVALPIALRQIKGDLVDIAESFANFFDEDAFSYYDEEDLVKKFFC